MYTFESNYGTHYIHKWLKFKLNCISHPSIFHSSFHPLLHACRAVRAAAWAGAPSHLFQLFWEGSKASLGHLRDTPMHPGSFCFSCLLAHQNFLEATVSIQGPSKLHPHPSFCFINSHGCSPVSILLPISVLQCPTSQQGLIGLLQLAFLSWGVHYQVWKWPPRKSPASSWAQPKRATFTMEERIMADSDSMSHFIAGM